MSSRRRYNRGFTLIELVLALALVSAIILISTNVFILGIKSHSMSIKEYDIQSSVRIATEEINKIARYSKAVFAVPQTYVDDGAMDPDWNYFMVADKKRIVSMEYNKDKGEFEERVLVKEQNNIEYEVFFEKVENATLDDILKYVIKAYTIDSNGNRSEEEKIVFESAVESINAVQVIDKGTGIPDGGIITQSTSLALAYRNDGQSSGKGNEYAYISLVVDVSGSMRLLPTDIDAEVSVPNKEKNGSRMQKVREALAGTEDIEGIVEQFSNEENIFVSLVPFSTTANYPSPIGYLNANSDDLHPIYDVHYNEVYSNNTSNKATLKQEVSDKLKANGGTNTGDGLRRAYQLHMNFRNRMKTIVRENERVHHYMILLVDGQSTYETATKALWKDNGEYLWTHDEGWWYSYSRFDWKVDYMPVKNGTTYYEQDGNVTVSTKYPSGTRPKNHDDYFSEGNIRYYGEARDNTSTSNGLAVIGSGNTFVGTGYVDQIGSSIESFDGSKGIKSYVIGYATGLKGRVEEIGEAIGTEEDKIFSYDDEDFDLQEVFESIANDILADYWVLAGPQIKN